LAIGRRGGHRSSGLTGRAGRHNADVAGQSQSFFGEQRFCALAAARPQPGQMNFAFLTSGLSCFRSILPRQQVIELALAAAFR